MLPDVALMVVVPRAKAVANPALLTVAMLATDDAHVTEVVRVFLLPSV
jgi:hypothetical protein